jgi:hypothetical protein
MWVRVTCPNGHRLKIETRFLGRRNRCPRCQANVYLWIQVVCPNGHSLKVQSKFAGKIGTCPECKARVQVPDMTEVIAMDTLGPLVSGTAVHQEDTGEEESMVAALDDSVVRRVEDLGPTRTCPMCSAKVPRSMRTCPTCNKYIGDPDIAEANAANSPKQCGECGAKGFPGDVICSSCGCPLE